jgi:hypothetical protein
MSRTLRVEDFRASDVTKIPSKERGFTLTFISPSILATGHYTLGVQIWEYPSFRLLQTINCDYTSGIVPFPDAPLVAVTNDMIKQPSVYNYITGEKVVKFSTRIHHRTLVALGKDVICYQSFEKKEVQAKNIYSNNTKSLKIQNVVRDMVRYRDNKFLGTSRNAKTLHIYMFNLSNNMQIEQMWVRETEALYDAMCATPEGVLVRTGTDELKHYSKTGDLLRTIVLLNCTSNEDLFWSTFVYVHDDIILCNNSYFPSVIDMKTGTLHALVENNVFLHRVAIHPYNSVMVVINESVSLDVYRLLPDVIPGEQIQNKLLMCRHFKDVLVNCLS